jgi:hypothetical protein
MQFILSESAFGLADNVKPPEGSMQNTYLAASAHTSVCSRLYYCRDSLLASETSDGFIQHIFLPTPAQSPAHADAYDEVKRVISPCSSRGLSCLALEANRVFSRRSQHRQMGCVQPLFASRLDPEQCVLAYVNAGAIAWVVRRDGIETLKAEPPLGSSDVVRFVVETINLWDGDVLLVHTSLGRGEGVQDRLLDLLLRTREAGAYRLWRRTVELWATEIQASLEADCALFMIQHSDGLAATASGAWERDQEIYASRVRDDNCFLRFTLRVATGKPTLSSGRRRVLR